MPVSPPLPSTPVSRSDGPPPRPEQADDATFDARWAAWIARGRRHDLAVGRTLRVVTFGAVIIGLLAALVVLAPGAR